MENNRNKGAVKDMIYGIQPVLEALQAGKEIDKLLINRESTNAQLAEIHRLAREQNIPVSRVPEPKLMRVTRKNHQGVIAYMSVISYASLDNIISSAYETGQVPFVLVLDQVTDVRNLGAIARSAECAGVQALIIPTKGAAQVTADAVRTSAGALNHIPVCRVEDLPETISYLQGCGLQVVGCTEKGEKTIHEMDFSVPTAIVMGNEEIGISNTILRTADHLAKIPMNGKINSLNVSVASGIILFEAVRQKSL
ncbi:23S rRNA (guanosine(2251)-2'-O)-methyltransferase RlmB [Sediminitomix flava]|uniref:23S rRNA (Guanosine2251-2'-O)-methyltransferase n=1 Tax=Sediminitomix flava TaxID=379075 RepID=A0A315Z7B1_SEDFL|nr:23S rRNA (guanosine(2251)-2'-O)-methyltransferase RlmB [Sediminitomix flava]PWJ39305.1 23S rRNA (guanosine2251-2'-O)-methyltransferase [Sediminitomix flava]